MHLPRISLVNLIRLFLFIVSLSLVGLVKKVYRPWVYQQGGWDFSIADWGPSLFFIFGMGMLIAAVVTTIERLQQLKYQTMAGVIIGALLYKISHALRPDQWFSWDDIIATIVGGLAAILVEVILTGARKVQEMHPHNHR